MRSRYTAYATQNIDYIVETHHPEKRDEVDRDGAKKWSEEAEWRPTSGRGELYSFTVIHRPVDPARFEQPYALAIVRLDEGPYVLTNLVECPLDRIRIGMRVAVRFERIDDDFTVYPFAPVEA